MVSYNHKKDLPDYYESLVHEVIYSPLLGGNSDSISYDPSTIYTINSLEYRSPEFGDGADLVTLGCSQTFGLGVPDESIWPKLLADKLNCSYANLGIPGASISLLVDKFFQYIYTYGAPKKVAFLMPGLERLDILSVPGIIEKNDGIAAPEVHINSTPMNLAIRGSNHAYIPNYSKRPYNFYEILPYETAAFESLKALARLIHICKTFKIDLALSSWNTNCHSFFLEELIRGKSGLDLSGYIKDSPVPDIYFDASLRCHDDPMPSRSSSWEVGTDEGRHMGRHLHLHYAEAFYDKLVSYATS